MTFSPPPFKGTVRPRQTAPRTPAKENEGTSTTPKKSTPRSKTPSKVIPTMERLKEEVGAPFKSTMDLKKFEERHTNEKEYRNKFVSTKFL